MIASKTINKERTAERRKRKRGKDIIFIHISKKEKILFNFYMIKITEEIVFDSEMDCTFKEKTCV